MSRQALFYTVSLLIMGFVLKLAFESIFVGVCLTIFNTLHVHARSNIFACTHINRMKYTNILWNIISTPLSCGEEVVTCKQCVIAFVCVVYASN